MWMSKGSSKKAVFIDSYPADKPPSLNHLIRLTDDTGLLQHASGIIPNREHGYCTDDNSRAVIAMAKYYARFADPEALRLLNLYLSFIMHAQNRDGSFKNLMDFDRTWQKGESSSDAFGRTLWALGTVLSVPPSTAYVTPVQACFDRALCHLPDQSPRGMAYSILGICDYLKQFPKADDIRQQLASAADTLANLYKKNSLADWQCFEGGLTYDNAVLPHALFAAGLSLECPQYIEIAEKTSAFLLESTFIGKYFSFIGSKGWYKRGQKKAKFDQQPIEVAGTIMMLKAAYDATKNSRFLELQKKAFDWFLGANDLHVPVYDSSTNGCNDALMEDGLNTNQGAESMVSFLLSVLSLDESGEIHHPPAAETRP
jgi:uncharacterized protein YyaL (SSP411 family)